MWSLKTLVVGGMLTATLLAGSAWYGYSSGKQSGMLQVQARWDAQRLEMERTAREALEGLRRDHARRLMLTMEIAHDTETRLARARADAVAATDAGRRLREHIATLTAAGGGAGASADPAAPASAPADATADLLADVQRRLDDAADQLAGFADQAHAAGQACERIADGGVRALPAAAGEVSDER